jgi:hypothetical protein
VYAWDFPAAKQKELLLTINGYRREVDILEIGDLVPFKFPVSEKHPYFLFRSNRQRLEQWGYQCNLNRCSSIRSSTSLATI